MKDFQGQPPQGQMHPPGGEYRPPEEQSSGMYEQQYQQQSQQQYDEQYNQQYQQQYDQQYQQQYQQSTQQQPPSGDYHPPEGQMSQPPPESQMMEPPPPSPTPTSSDEPPHANAASRFVASVLYIVASLFNLQSI